MNVLRLFTVFAFLITSLQAQTQITFDDQDWSTDQVLDSNLTISDFNFISNKNFYTNYGYNFDVYSVSIYFVFENPGEDKIIIDKTGNNLFNLAGISAYQVSETSSDTLIIEGWSSGKKIYSSLFNNITSWQELNLNYNNIDKVIIKTENSGEENLTDFNFDNFIFNSPVLSAENIEEMDYNLSQNYPNPFNPRTTISYNLKNGSQVKLIVYDILGNEVASLVDEYKDAGKYKVSFGGEELSSGIYIYKLITNEFVSVKKMMLVK